MKKSQIILDKISHHYKEGNEFDSILTPFEMKTIKNYLAGDKFLELGCSIGDSTSELIKLAKSVDVIEGSDENIKIAEQKISKLNKKRVKVRFYNQFWEDADFSKDYSDIIWIRGIEHIKNPKLLLKKIAYALKKSGGRLHLVTVNAYSLNRRIGVYMNLLKEPHQLSERDKRFGHYKIYDRSQLSETLKGAGFKIINWQGIMLKPLPNDKMYKLYRENPKLIEAFYDISDELPDYCTEIYMCAIPS